MLRSQLLVGTVCWRSSSAENKAPYKKSKCLDSLVAILWLLLELLCFIMIIIVMIMIIIMIFFIIIIVIITQPLAGLC